MPAKPPSSEPAAERSNAPDAGLHEACSRVLAQQSAALSIRDPEWRPLFANAAYLQLFDTTLDAWMRGDLGGHFGTKSAQNVTDVIVPRVSAGKRWQGELEILTPKGVRKQVLAELNCIRDEGGAITHYYAHYAEVTPLKHLERQLEYQVEFLHGIIDTVPDPLIVKNRQHAWMAVNKAFCALTGHGREELIGKSDYDFFPKEEADLFWRQDDEAFASGRMVANEEKITNKRGEVRLISTKKQAVTIPGGETVVIAVARDVTAERHLERTMADSYHQLEMSLAALKRDLSGLQENVASGVSRAEAIRELIARTNDSYTEYIRESGLDISPRPEPRPPRRMSSREYQVFTMLIKGARIKDIAANLGITSNAVSTYRARIMRKLELKSITEMVRYALRQGLM